MSPPKRHSGKAVLVLLALLVVCHGSRWAKAQTVVRRKPNTHPYLESWYDARRNLPLAACAAGTLTEQDLLLFRLMKRARPAALFHDWEKSQRAKERERLTRQLEEALRELAHTLAFAERAPDGIPSLVDEKYIRFLKYPVYHWVWIERVLKPSMQLEQVDLIKYYHDHRDEFYQPESVRVRYIFRDISESTRVAARDTLEEEMRVLRDRAAGGEDFVELARAESDAPSAVRGGELPRLYRGMFIEEFETQAFALEPGQLSPVFWGPGGLYLVQCLEKHPEQQESFEAINAELREAVEHKTLRYLYDYQLLRLIQRRDYRAFYSRFLDIPETGKMFEIGRYELSRNEFLDIFPFVLNEPLTLTAGMFSLICREILQGELVAREIERLGLAGDPLLVAADRMARRILRADKALRATLAVPLALTESEVQTYYEENRERLGYQAQWRVLRIEAFVRNPYLRHPSQLPALRTELRSQFEQALRELRSAFGEERSKAAEERVLAGEPPVAPSGAASIPEDEAATATARFRRQLMALPRCLDVLTEASTSDYEFIVTDLGYCTAHDAKVYPYVKQLREGDYGRIAATRSGNYVCHFVARYIPGAPADYEQVRAHIRRQYIAARQAEALDRLRGELARESALRVRLPEVASQD